MGRSAALGSATFWKLALAGIALLWGFSFVVMKDAVGLLPTFTLLAIRFAVAAAIMLVVCRKSLRSGVSRRDAAVGAAVGVALWAAYVAQTLGLAQTTAGKNAFLTGTYCVLVPFVSHLMGGERLGFYNVGAAAICLAGIGLVALDDLAIGTGDLLTLVGAVFFALEICIVGKYGASTDVNAVSFWMFLVVAALSAVSAVVFEPGSLNVAWTWDVVGRLAFLAVICTCFNMFVQNAGLAHVESSTGSLLLSLESPSGVLFSVLLAGEALSARLLVGFALIFAAIVISETHLSFLKPRSSASEEELAAQDTAGVE